MRCCLQTPFVLVPADDLSAVIFVLVPAVDLAVVMVAATPKTSSSSSIRWVLPSEQTMSPELSNCVFVLLSVQHASSPKLRFAFCDIGFGVCLRGTEPDEVHLTPYVTTGEKLTVSSSNQPDGVAKRDNGQQPDWASDHATYASSNKPKRVAKQDNGQKPGARTWSGWASDHASYAYKGVKDQAKKVYQGK